LERAAVISEVDDRFGGVWSDAGESFELGDCGGVEVDRLRGRSFLSEGNAEKNEKNDDSACDQEQNTRTGF